MAQVRFIADLHFHHENCAKWRGFKSVEEMNELIVTNWNKVVHKKDVTYILGDITNEKANYDILDRLNGVKHVVLGNHDDRRHVRKLLDHVNTVAGAIKYKKVHIITHIPVHSSQMNNRYKFNIHGHVHEKSIKALTWDYELKEDKEILHPNYINVSVENIDYTPRTLKELLTIVI
ncbi:MAG: hypothetical protein KUG81_08720 [Gammaproteobacteria bacterium]|nr:hypothetical protein [Gammaproteobacteria bacterium]